VPLLPSCPLQTILLSDQVGSDSPLQIVIAIWCTFLKLETRQTVIIATSMLPHPTQQVQIQKNSNCHYYLQRVVAPDWMGSIAL
jgi:hypothetical protein